MKSQLIMIMLICGLTLFNNNLLAQKHPDKQKKLRKTTQAHRNNNKRATVGKTQQFPRNKVVVVNPRRVRSNPNLAANHTTIAYHGSNYYYQEGHYYNYYNNNYTLVNPPRGIRIRFLPYGNRRIFIGNVPHYYYMGAYYRGVGNEYEIVEPNVGTIVPELPQDNVEEITIDGQTYYEYNDILYKPIVTANGVQYEVVGKLND